MGLRVTRPKQTSRHCAHSQSKQGKVKKRSISEHSPKKHTEKNLHPPRDKIKREQIAKHAAMIAGNPPRTSRENEEKQMVSQRKL